MIAIDVVVTPTAIVKFTVATAPLAMAEFEPDTTQVSVPLLPLQLKLFEAAVAAEPAVAEIASTLVVGYVIVHWRDAGW